MFARLALVIVLLAGSAWAQPAAALGKPLPAPDLPVGTVSVRVVDGSVAAPHDGIAVWLSVDGIAKTVTTNAAGRAVFSGLAAGAKVVAAVSVGGASIKSDAFVLPAEGGTRVLISTVPFSGGPPMPRARDISGTPRPDEGTPLGALDVRLTYNDLADAHPPSKVPVRLVSYAADGSVAVVTQRTDAHGFAHFTGLDRTGTVAYYALATLPRAGKADRLIAVPVVPDATAGVRIVLSAEARTAKAPPIDDLAPVAPVAKGKLHVRIEGVVAPGSQLRVVDAATGEVLARELGEKETTLALAGADRVVYVEAFVGTEYYRSRPFQAVADRGAEIVVYAYPRVVVQFVMLAEPAGLGIATSARFSIQNYSWIPYATPLAVPLPKGFAHAVLADDDLAIASLTPTGFTFVRPLAPGEQRVRVGFDLPPGADGKVHWDLDLPNGALESSFRMYDEPGTAITGAKLPVSPITVDGADYLTIDAISILPKQSMAMVIELPKLTPAQSAIARACRPLDPDRKTKLRGKPMPDFTAPELDGKSLHLSALRGKPILVHFMASWDMLTSKELPTLAPFAAALGKELAVVLVSSDADPKEVAAKVGAKPPFRVVLDPPTSSDPNDAIGPITKSWGVHLIPESFLIDKRGVVRLYFSNSRDWSTPDARACIEAVARD